MKRIKPSNLASKGIEENNIHNQARILKRGKHFYNYYLKRNT